MSYWSTTLKFAELQNDITRIGVEWHRDTILRNTVDNAPRIEKSIRDIDPSDPVLVVSAGPSLYRQESLAKVRDAQFKGTIVSTDGSYVQCLKAGIIPDYVVTLDPHPTRMIRWFGDPDFATNSEGDDYFARQDLDLTFRTNAAKVNEQNIELVNQYAHRSRFIVSTTSPQNVVMRLEAAGVVPYWFVPLVDKPTERWSLTANMVRETGLPAMNTGGTVGTAAWVFSHTRLKAQNVAVVGMDFGYPMETPLDKTQEYNLVSSYGGDISEFFPRYTGFWGEAYTGPTYWYYRSNFLDLLAANKAQVINCSGAGLLFGPGVGCMELEQWLAYAT